MQCGKGGFLQKTHAAKAASPNNGRLSGMIIRQQIRNGSDLAAQLNTATRRCQTETTPSNNQFLKLTQLQMNINYNNQVKH